MLSILTHLAYRANAKTRAIPNEFEIVTVLKERKKRALADVNCN